MLPDLSVNQLIGVFQILIGIAGLYIAYSFRRSRVFRIKLALVYSLPFVLGVEAAMPYWFNFMPRHPEHREILFMMFVILATILYWREVKSLMTSRGYHKRALVDFLDMMPDLVWMKDKDQKFTYMNEAVKRGWFCCTDKDMLNKTEQEIYANVIRHASFSNREVIDESNRIVFEDHNACKFMATGEVNGNPIALQVFKAPLFKTLPDESKKFVGMIAMARDLTYDLIDHSIISELCESDDIDHAIEEFEKHKTRYAASGNINDIIVSPEPYYIDRCSEENKMFDMGV